MIKERVLSCIQPTGKGELHLGNYFGAIKNWVRLQNEHDCIYGVVDYHAITSEYDPNQLQENTLEMAMDLIACGIDPDKVILFVQSHVPEHTELCWILFTVTAYGDLARMTQFKQKASEREFVNAGLFNYPVLMAADILVYKATKIPVGRDQEQHIELTREIARKFNAQFGDFFPLPEAIFTRGAKIMSLADPTKKMSKSYGFKHYVGLMEPEDVIRQKIRTAVTDPGPGQDGRWMSPGIENLFTLLELTADASVYKAFEDEYRRGTLKYEKLKDAVFAHLMEELKPIRERKRELERDKEGVKEILRRGAEKARAIAQKNMAEIRKRVGVGPF